MQRRRAGLIVLLATALVPGLTGQASAATISISGVNSGDYATATIVLVFNSQTNTMTFTGTNTSAITQPGSTSTITSFGFDLPPLGNASSSGWNGFTGQQAPSLSSSFTFTDGDAGSVSGFGSVVLDFAFLTGASFGSGNINDGLLPGESASFTVSGAAFAGLTEQEIADAIFVGFQNVNLAAGTSGTDVGTLQAVPEPTTTALLLLGLVGLARSARKRNVLR